jgi:hypothetical protein
MPSHRTHFLNSLMLLALLIIVALAGVGAPTLAQTSHAAGSPQLLISTYLGGAGDDAAQAIAYDHHGNILVAGWTYSAQLPGTIGARNDRDIFVTKLNPAGTAVLYSVRLGGTSDDSAYGLAVDSQGNAWVTGETDSADFPTKHAFWPYGGGYDTFALKLDPNGTLLASSFLGDPNGDRGNAIAVDPQGNAYVVGELPADYGPAVLVAKIAADGTQLIYRGYFGQAQRGFLKGSKGQAAAVDAAGQLYIAGTTNTIAFDATGLITKCVWIEDEDCMRSDAFVVVLNPAGDTIVASTLLGGHENEEAGGIAIDSDHNIYVTGSTFSSDFPLQDAWQAHKSGLDTFTDAFLAKLNPAADHLLYATYYGGSLWDEPHALTIDADGRVNIVGLTSSTDLSVPNAVQPTITGTCIAGSNERPCYDAFVATFEPTGALSAATYLGGNFDDYANAAAVGANGAVALAGRAESFEFPTTSGALQPTKAADDDAFIALIGAAIQAPPSGEKARVYVPMLVR